MKRRLDRLLLIFCCALLLSGLAVAQSDEWNSLIQETWALHQQGKYDRAVVVAKKALEIAERDGHGLRQTVASHHYRDE